MVHLKGNLRNRIPFSLFNRLGRYWFTTYKFLRSLGIAERPSWNIVMYSQGWWSMTLKAAVGKAMGKHWFAQYGLYSILQQVTR